MITISLPLHTVSLTNSREHWRKRATRASKHRFAARTLCGGVCRSTGLPAIVTLTRIAPSAGLDDDNLPPALKSVRDGIADAFGVDDRDPRIKWQYAQERGKRYGVDVTIEEGVSGNVCA